MIDILQLMLINVFFISIFEH